MGEIFLHATVLSVLFLLHGYLLLPPCLVILYIGVVLNIKPSIPVILVRHGICRLTQFLFNSCLIPDAPPNLHKCKQGVR